jgi:hypothetical protein
MQKWKKNHFNLFLNKNYFETCTGHTHAITCCRSFKIQPGPTGWPGARDWNQAGLKKKQGKKNPVWPGQKSGCNPLSFIYFFNKTTSFLFFLKKRIDPSDPVTRLKHGTRALNRAGSKYYDMNILKSPSLSLTNDILKY